MMNNGTMKSCQKQVSDVLTKMKDTSLRCDFGMNLEVVGKEQSEKPEKQWKTQKNCTVSLLDLAIAGAVFLTAMTIGACMDCRHGKKIAEKQ